MELNKEGQPNEILMLPDGKYFSPGKEMEYNNEGIETIPRIKKVLEGEK
jgi:hypothetical protein